MLLEFSSWVIKEGGGKKIGTKKIVQGYMHEQQSWRLGRWIFTGQGEKTWYWLSVELRRFMDGNF